MRRSAIPDEQLNTLLDQGLKDSEIAKALGVKQCNIHHRLKRIRNAREEAAGEKSVFDLRELDTVRIGVRRYRVMGISEEGFTIREVLTDDEIRYSHRIPQTRDFTKKEYLAGKTGIRKLEQIAPVTVYVDEGRKERQREEPMEEKQQGTNQECEKTITTAAEERAIVSEPQTDTEETIVDDELEKRYLGDIRQIVNTCRPYAGSAQICQAVNELTKLILEIGVGRQMGSSGFIKK